MSAEVIDRQKSEAFAGRMTEMLNHSALMLMTSIGHRSGLFDTMARSGPGRSGEIAERARLSERYVREWLAAMVTGGIVTYDPETQAYRLPAEHAAWLTRSATPNNLAQTAQWIGLLGGVEDHVTEAFRHGRGVPYDRYARFQEVMAEESMQTVIAGLEDHILPLAPGLVERLTRGIDVIDLGCGRGLAMVHLAGKYPRSRFLGVDVSQEAVMAGMEEAHRREVRNVRLIWGDAAEFGSVDTYDLVTAFDAIHDQARPEAVLANIRRILKPSGVFLMQDIRASSCVHCNVDHPIGPFIYTVSCMHCMSVSLANGGPGLGAAWGKELALRMLADAGFDDVCVHELPHDSMNDYYVTGK